jgi:ribonucleoside-diphosphate reductase alpha chain
MIKIDKSRDKLFDELGLRRLRESYMRDEEESPQERFAYVSEKFSSNPEHAQRLYDYSSKHWLSYATPILSYGKIASGLGISCYLSYIHDSKEGLVDALSETNWLSMLGGGVGLGVDIRSADEKSVGIMPHLKIYDAATLAYKQGTRRGSFATYLNIDHPDIEMFIEMRKATGDPRIRTQNLHHGVNITDDFMNIIEKCMIDPNYDDTWLLKDPNGKVRGKTSAKLLWQKIIETRMEKGEPYLHFIDTSNRALPKWQKELGLKITQSNLCVSGDTIITILDENENIKDIKMNELGNYMNYSLIKVYSYDINKNELGFKPVTNFAMTNEKTKVMKITSENGNFIICTPEHKIYTINRGYVLAKELLENDKLFCDF